MQVVVKHDLSLLASFAFDLLDAEVHLIYLLVSQKRLFFFHHHVSLLLIFHFLTLLQWEMLLGNRLAPSFQEAKCRP